jgi:hypothetical protein
MVVDVGSAWRWRVAFHTFVWDSMRFFPLSNGINALHHRIYERMWKIEMSDGRTEGGS